jgi:hypothetical protein
MGFQFKRRGWPLRTRAQARRAPDRDDLGRRRLNGVSRSCQRPSGPAPERLVGGTTPCTTAPGCGSARPLFCSAGDPTL